MKIKPLAAIVVFDSLVVGPENTDFYIAKALPGR
jgi:hypothetical protein